MNPTQMQGDNASVWKGQGIAGPLLPANSPELEVKDAQLIFGAIWRELEGEFGRRRIRFPKELILLGGAPGAGKGTNTDFIRKVRGIEAPPIVVSQLLDTPEARAVKARGGMVGDREVVGILLRKLLEPEQQNGALLDGFPRTKVQVECLKLLFDEMIALRREFSGTPEVIHFKQPIFHIMVLFVDEAESVARQFKRGRQVVAHNEEVARSGVGERWEERATDFSEGLARNRYRVFKEQTYDAWFPSSRSSTTTSSTPRRPSPKYRPTSSASWNIRARWSWTGAPSTGFGGYRLPAKSSGTPARTSSAG
jgi:adenylate kinase